LILRMAASIIPALRVKDRELAARIGRQSPHKCDLLHIAGDLFRLRR
jgi:hypothetical protein